MLRPTAVKVVPLNDYFLKVTFDNAQTRLFNVEPYIKGEWYGKLAKNDYYKLATPDGFTVVWPDGQDICPDELYYNSKLI